MAVNEISVWVPVISALTGGGFAILVSHLNHRYAREREETAAAERLRNETRASEDKLNLDRYLIATQLIFKLEEYAEKCAYVGLDKGRWHGDFFDGFLHAVPEIDLLSVTADWRALPLNLLYRIRELSAQHERACRGTDFREDDPDRGDSEEMFKVLRNRQGQFLKQGLLAMFLAIRLRRLCDLPGSPLFNGRHSTGEVMWGAWRQLRREAYERAVRYREFHKAAPAVTG